MYAELPITLNPFYMDNVYLIHLIKNYQPFMLIQVYMEGATGLSANMTLGVLINLRDMSVQYLSTWGSVVDNFFDTNNDGSFEFFCISHKNDQDESILVPNIFSMNAKNEYTINITKESTSFIIYYLDENREVIISDKSKLQDKPDIFHCR